MNESQFYSFAIDSSLFFISLTLTAIATNGGYRTIETPNGEQVNTFIGQNSSKTTQFRFDFVNPHHCLLDGNCHSVAFNVDKDITKVMVPYNFCVVI